MFYKVYNIQSGQTIKAGFKNEEEAKEWLELARPGKEDNYLVEEMDADEIEDWKLKASDEENLEEESEEDDLEVGRYTYKTEDDAEDEDDELMGGMYEVEEDDD